MFVGAQFCRGFGGIGAILRYPIQFLEESEVVESSVPCGKSKSLDGLFAGLDFAEDTDDLYEDFYPDDSHGTGSKRSAADDADLMFGMPHATDTGVPCQRQQYIQTPFNPAGVHAHGIALSHGQASFRKLDAANISYVGGVPGKGVATGMDSRGRNYVAYERDFLDLKEET